MSPRRSLARAPQRCILRRQMLHESLCRRELLAGSIFFDPLTSRVVVDGTTLNDVVEITVAAVDEISVSLSNSASSQQATFVASQVSRILFRGDSGNDLFVNQSPTPASAYGELGNDTLIGGTGDDLLDGGWGSDSLSGGNGDDFLQGGDASDHLAGEAGADILRGGGGADTLDGGDDLDRLFGESAGDLLLGGDGGDVLRGGDGVDVLAGGPGDDLLFGENDADSLAGGEGSDRLDGGAGTDWISGDEADDSLAGGPGNDVLIGGPGNDTLAGNDEHDSLSGGPGDDYLDGGSHNDHLLGDDGNDQIYAGSGNDFLSGGTGNDTMFGSSGADNMQGGPDDDHLNGGPDNDVLVGDDGADYVQGGNGNDVVRGGAGDDSLRGGAGDDQLQGDEDRDTLTGDGGDDTLVGGAGHDLLRGGQGDDRLAGSDGDDSLFGEAGIDVLFGDTGNDRVDGGLGDDQLDGGTGDDSLYGAGGNDWLLGQSGNDLLLGQSGDDVLRGGAGDDVLVGAGGVDLLFGDEDDDQVFGGTGMDVLRGGSGDDHLFGQGANDHLLGDDGHDALDGGNNFDTLDGGAGNDVLAGSASNDTLSGGAGDDVLRGGSSHDLLLGGTGNDQLAGEGGNDSLFGGDDNDLLQGGFGLDQLSGGSGNDLLAGGDGNDDLSAGDGNDVLIGGAGRDALTGSAGEDLLTGGATSFDVNVEQLTLVQTVWSAGDSYSDRVVALQQHASVPLNTPTTVLDDAHQDTLRGGTGLDWFFLPGVAPGQSLSELGAPNPRTIWDFVANLDDIRDREHHEQLETVVPHARHDSAQNQRDHQALMDLVRYDQVTHVSVQSGAWSEPTTWVNGMVPGSSARVLISAGQTVTVDRRFEDQMATVRVDGTLQFSTSQNSELQTGLLVGAEGSIVRMGSNEAPISMGATARIVIADIGPQDQVMDPLNLGRGVVLHGSVEIHGESKTGFTEFAEPPRQGDTQLVLADSPVNWRAGDQLVIAGADAGGLQDELVELTSITGNVVVIDRPLAHDHVAPRSDLSTHIANLSRNAVIESESTELDRRGHVMFMHTRDVDIAFAGFYSLGRTDKLQAVNSPVVSAEGVVESGTGTNPRGRYAMHFHRNGVVDDGAPAKVHGSVVRDSPGWGYVNHSSFVEFTDNVAHNVNGSAFVTEAGDEIGSFVGNLSIRTHGSDDAIGQRAGEQDFGHQGDGFWLQGAGVQFEGNIASGSKGHGIILFTRGLVEVGGRVTFPTANLSEPSIAGGAAHIEVDDVPIDDFRNNTAYASNEGIAIMFSLREAAHDQGSRVENLTAWNNAIGFHLPYTRNLIANNVTVVAGFSSLGTMGIKTNDVTESIVLNAADVSGYRRGYHAPSKGDNRITGGRFENLDNILVPTAIAARTLTIDGDIQFSSLSPALLRGLTQRQVVTTPELTPLEGSLAHLFVNDVVLLNYGSFVNRRLYFLEQAANFILFPTNQAGINPQHVGLTNQQLFTNFQIALGGELAPALTTVLPELRGLLGPEQ